MILVWRQLWLLWMPILKGNYGRVMESHLSVNYALDFFQKIIINVLLQSTRIRNALIIYTEWYNLICIFSLVECLLVNGSSHFPCMRVMLVRPFFKYIWVIFREAREGCDKLLQQVCGYSLCCVACLSCHFWNLMSFNSYTRQSFHVYMWISIIF